MSVPGSPPMPGPGKVLVSQTVKDLVAGSGIHLQDRGLIELKGLPGDWRLYLGRGTRRLTQRGACGPPRAAWNPASDRGGRRMITPSSAGSVQPVPVVVGDRVQGLWIVARWSMSTGSLAAEPSVRPAAASTRRTSRTTLPLTGATRSPSRPTSTT
jgi:hypothetical protein